jgi:hypothetical protein
MNAAAGGCWYPPTTGGGGGGSGGAGGCWRGLVVVVHSPPVHLRSCDPSPGFGYQPAGAVAAPSVPELTPNPSLPARFLGPPRELTRAAPSPEPRAGALASDTIVAAVGTGRGSEQGGAGMADLGSAAARRALKAAAVVALAGGALAACSSGTPATSTGTTGSGGTPTVLLVGSYQGKKGTYSTIQAAVDAAKAGDWILIGPGDYHEAADHDQAPTAAEQAEGGVAGVLVTTPDLHLRGMNRGTVIVDGDKAGAPSPCDPSAAWQDFGIADPSAGAGKHYGRNGIVAFRVGGVSVENLTVCNFLSGSGNAGNEVWWDGGDGSGQIGLHGYTGNYLTATSTYFGGESTAAAYGIFSSNSSGPASWNQIYADNFNDSGMYVGACEQVCGVTIDHAWMEYNALGYSGTNSGGAIVIENSQFDENQDGADTNSSISGDPPAPQDGACPGGAISPITHTHSCWVFMDNYVHDNNNANSPAAGSAAAGPYGTGMTISGGRDVTVMDNRFVNNGAWGTLFVPYPDSGKPVDGLTCTGTGGEENAAFGCVYDPEGDALVDNTYVHDGYFGNPSNSDFGQITLNSGQPQDCFSGNTAPAGSAPPGLEQSEPTCGALTKSNNTGGDLLVQVLCDTGFGGCPAGVHYPKPSHVVMHPLPTSLPTMPDPCSGVPANAWCPGTTAVVRGGRGAAPASVAALSAGAGLVDSGYRRSAAV